MTLFIYNIICLLAKKNLIDTMRIDNSYKFFFINNSHEPFIVLLGVPAKVMGAQSNCPMKNNKMKLGWACVIFGKSDC